MFHTVAKSGKNVRVLGWKAAMCALTLCLGISSLGGWPPPDSTVLMCILDMIIWRGQRTSGQRTLYQCLVTGYVDVGVGDGPLCHCVKVSFIDYDVSWKRIIEIGKNIPFLNIYIRSATRPQSGRAHEFVHWALLHTLPSLPGACAMPSKKAAAFPLTQGSGN